MAMKKWSSQNGASHKPKCSQILWHRWETARSLRLLWQGVIADCQLGPTCWVQDANLQKTVPKYKQTSTLLPEAPPPSGTWNIYSDLPPNQKHAIRAPPPPWSETCIPAAHVLYVETWSQRGNKKKEPCLPGGEMSFHCECLRLAMARLLYSAN